MTYADLPGRLALWYEAHGSGPTTPLILLHGGIGAGETLGAIVPALSARRRVILVDLRAHGHTADPGGPLRWDDMAGDVAALVEHLALPPADVMGYSLGGEVALRLAIEHPETVRRLVVVSVAFRRDGNHPEVVDQFDAMSGELADVMEQAGAPPYTLYQRVAPEPSNFRSLIEKTAEMLKHDYDWSDEVKALSVPTMLVFADNDSIRPSHIVEFFALLGGGLRDAGWDGSQKSVNRLAILPGLTHYDMHLSPALPAAVLPFLDAATLP